MRWHLIFIFTISAFLSTLAANAYAAGFDCGKAATTVEKLICSNQNLSDADSKLSALFKASQGSRFAEEIKKEQRSWVKERNKCDDIHCLNSMYRDRIFVVSLSIGQEASSADGSLFMSLPPIDVKSSVKSRIIDISQKGRISFSHDAAGGKYSFFTDSGAALTVSFLWDLEENALSDLEKLDKSENDVWVVGKIEVYEDGSASMSRAHPINILSKDVSKEGGSPAKQGQFLVDGFRNFKFGMTYDQLKSVDPSCNLPDYSGSHIICRLDVMSAKRTAFFCSESHWRKAGSFPFNCSDSKFDKLSAIKIYFGNANSDFFKKIFQELSNKYGLFQSPSEFELSEYNRKGMRNGNSISWYFANAQIVLTAEVINGEETAMVSYLSYQISDWLKTQLISNSQKDDKL
ncbi:uncharacterized protein DUF1311 [Azospirillum brasilense]|uniref:Uncharacterized protein DUF1311 n=1 Tax=Azospirillum brasilense TaxID=192 RepID=A0A560AP30_AZOBR|nr:lysozyme inhibitor LprI family protein [Azospirillum brasilense]TWA62120.1 uncharacterized protein DUF1311 [Azospirillum brasilense]